jgi:hypothetical protein
MVAASQRGRYRWPPCRVGTASCRVVSPCRACPCHGPSLRPTTRHMGHRAVLRAWRATGSTGSRRRSAWQSGRAGGGASGRSQGWSSGGSGQQAAVPAGSVSGRRRCACSALVESSGWRARRLGAELSRAPPAAGWSSATCPQGGGASAPWAPGARMGRGGGAPQHIWPAGGRRCNCHGDAAGCGSRAGHRASPLAVPCPCRVMGLAGGP